MGLSDKYLTTWAAIIAPDKKSSYCWFLVPHHGFESGDELGRLPEEPVPRAVVDHDEVRVVTVQRNVVAVLHLHVGVVPEDHTKFAWQPKF